MRHITLLTIATAATFASADLVTYRYNGEVSTQTYWSGFHGVPVELGVTIDTSTAASSQSADQALYNGAVVDGYFQIGETRFNIAENPTTNIVNVRTNVYNQFTDSFYNQYQVTVSSDGIARDGWEFPGNIMLVINDRDPVADTVLDLGLLQPLDTLSTISDGGVDGVVASMGALRGVFSTITSGNGAVSVLIPAPRRGPRSRSRAAYHPPPSLSTTTWSPVRTPDQGPASGPLFALRLTRPAVAWSESARVPRHCWHGPRSRTPRRTRPPARPASAPPPPRRATRRAHPRPARSRRPRTGARG